MCRKSAQEIIHDVDEHLQKSGRNYYSDFYVGTADDAEHKLFEEHYVRREGGWWIYRTAENPATAQEVKKHYLELGMRGEEGVPDGQFDMIYIYAVEPTTTE